MAPNWISSTLATRGLVAGDLGATVAIGSPDNSLTIAPEDGSIEAKQSDTEQGGFVEASVYRVVLRPSRAVRTPPVNGSAPHAPESLD